MIQTKTILKVSDNSGAKTVQCIKILGGFKKKYAKLGDTIIISIKKLRNKSKKISKVKKGEIYKALIIRTKIKQRKKDGSENLLQQNSVILLNKKNNPISTRIIGPIPKILKKKIPKIYKYCDRTYLNPISPHMNFLKYFYLKTLKYDLTNKFHYNKTKKLPQLKKIVLNIGSKTTEIKSIASNLLALELISKKKGTLTTTKHSNVFLKIRKGNPVGCKVVLRKNNLINFLTRILIEILPKTKNFNGFTLKIKKNVFSYELHETFSFKELEENYYLFNNIPKLDITIITNSTIKEELIFILKLLQFPFK